jgi:hypothetical protein
MNQIINEYLYDAMLCNVMLHDNTRHIVVQAKAVAFVIGSGNRLTRTRNRDGAEWAGLLSQNLPPLRSGFVFGG